jgi:hypothetical protein
VTVGGDLLSLVHERGGLHACLVRRCAGVLPTPSVLPSGAHAAPRSWLSPQEAWPP